MPTDLGTIVCKFGDDPSICLGEEAILTDQTDRQTVVMGKLIRIDSVGGIDLANYRFG